MPSDLPTPGLIDPITLHLPRRPAGPDASALPRILHVTDLHIRRSPSKRLQRLLAELASDAYPGCDLLLVTGDVMHDPGHEKPALDFLPRLIDAAKPRFGAFGCFGNHDSAEFQQQARDLPVTWLCDAAHRMSELPVNLLGLSCSRTNKQGDLIAALLNEAYDPTIDASQLRILLAHLPTWLTPASEAGIDLVLSGHTHGGQCRLPGRKVIYNSCDDWPLNLSSGVLQQGRTLSVISRGLGESNWQGLRFLCPAHAPLITLQPADAASSGGETPRLPTLIVPW